jgi:catechol 2,3-dioxygenase-like lactoylglutathione lyase family enzyme
MFSHVTIGSNDIARSKKFYDAVLGAIGGKPGHIDDKGRLSYAHNNGFLLITKPLNGEPASCLARRRHPKRGNRNRRPAGCAPGGKRSALPRLPS